MQMQQMGMPPQNQSQPQPPFNPQLARPMQASPLPPQQDQNPMFMNSGGQQASLQQQQPFPPNPQQHAPLPGFSGEQFTPQENDRINHMATRMAGKTSKADMDKIQQNLQNMSPEQRQMLSKRGLDPLAFFFRSQAQKEYLRQKGIRLAAARVQNAGVESGNMLMPGAIMQQQQRQVPPNMVGGQGQQAMPGNGAQSLDPSFMGNVDHIRGQQAGGLHAQEAGELVVPASSPQRVNPQQFGVQQGMFQPQQLGQPSQPNVTRPMTNPNLLAQQQQQFQNVQQAQTEKMQQAAHLQAQSQAQARAQATARAQFAMSNQRGSMNPQMSHGMPQPNTGMSTMNRPPGFTNQVPQPQGTPQPRPPSRPPIMGQQLPNQQPGPQMQQRFPPSQNGQPGAPVQRYAVPSGLPEKIQQHMSFMNPEQQQAFLNNVRRNQANNQQQQMQRANLQNQANPMQRRMSQPGQQPQMANGPNVGDPHMSVSQPMQPNLSGGMVQMPQQNQVPQAQQLLLQQQRQQQHQAEMFRQQMQRQQNASIPDMTDEQVREMDKASFPPSMINGNANVPLPKNVKTWGQLKQWAVGNPQFLREVTLPKLLILQRLHFGSSSGQQPKDTNRQPTHPGQGPPGMMASAQGQTSAPQAPNSVTAPMRNQQPMQRPQQTAQNMQTMQTVRPVTEEEVQMARMRLPPQMQSMSDEEVKTLVLNHKHKQAMQRAAQARQAAFGQQTQPGQMQPQGQQMPQPQRPQAADQGAPPGVVQHQPPQIMNGHRPQAGPHNARPASAQVQNKAARPANAQQQTPAAQQGPKNLKRSSRDDVVEVPNPNNSQVPQNQPPPVAGQAQPRQAIPSISKEQLAHMTPEQRSKFEALFRQRQLMQQGPGSSAASDDRYRQLYQEAIKDTPRGPPVPMLPETRANMAKRLRDTVEMLSRMDGSLNMYLKAGGDVKWVKTLMCSVSEVLPVLCR